jgi:predicted amidohydrolase YtcJ
VTHETLLLDVEVQGTRTDVRVLDQRLAEIAPGLAPLSTTAEIVNGRGGALIPGLHDHHVHLLAMAAAMDSVDLTSSKLPWAEALRRAMPDVTGWIRAIGHHDALSMLDRDSLDRVRSDVPVRVQHRGGGLWILNSKALSHLPETQGSMGDQGVERDEVGRRTGRFWRRDDLIRTAVATSALPDLTGVKHRLRRLGLTGVTDASPDLDPSIVEHLQRVLSAGPDRLRLMLLGAGSSGGTETWAQVGPLKLLLHDHQLPDPDTLAERIGDSHAAGRPVAVHCVTRASLVLTLAAIELVGPMEGDRIEHGSVVPPELVEWIGRLGLRVVTQPAFLHDRGDDYLAAAEGHDVPHLYPYAALLASAIRVAPSSDAPYSSPDPWATMQAARDRLSRSGRRVGDDQGVTPLQVLQGYLSPPGDPGGQARELTEGAQADLCLLHVSLSEALRSCSSDVVRRTWVGGE